MEIGGQTQNQNQRIQNYKKIGNSLLNPSKNPNYQISDETIRLLNNQESRPFIEPYSEPRPR